MTPSRQASAVAAPRIVSLVPSVTELLFELGLADRVVGVSAQCHYPPEVHEKPALTRSLVEVADGTAGAAALVPTAAVSRSATIDAAYTLFRFKEGTPYALDARRLAEVAPDLVFDQGICDVCAVGEEAVDAAVCALATMPKVVTISVATLAGILESVTAIAEAAGAPERGRALRQALQARVDAVRSVVGRPTNRPRVFVMEWLDPVWCSGRWVPELVEIAGGEDRLGCPGDRSIRRTWDEVLAWAPGHLLIAPCSYAIEDTLRELPELASRPGWAALPAVRRGQVWLADSGYFSHHSHRTVEGLEMLAHVLRPRAFPNRWSASQLARLADARGGALA